MHRNRMEESRVLCARSSTEHLPSPPSLCDVMKNSRHTYETVCDEQNGWTSEICRSMRRGVRRREWQRVREWEREIAILPTLDNYPHSRHTLS